MAKVLVKNVDKIFDNGFHAVKDVSFEAEDKEFVILVGPSGCGKSTTLRMIAGLEEINSGEIHIGDRIVNDVPPKNRDIAMVFQNYALYPHMTVYDNMAFALKLRKFKKEEIEKTVIETASLLEIEELLDRKPKQLPEDRDRELLWEERLCVIPKFSFLMNLFPTWMLSCVCRCGRKLSNSIRSWIPP